jgi:8-oxo-dGTP pyrophosphatase MutT (NUDIX family)
MRLGYRVAYRMFEAHAFLRRPRVRGCMVLVSDPAGRILLVRHTYGDRRVWELPGGWVEEAEEPVEAARRETREELGADIAEWRRVGAIDGLWHFKREQLYFFAAPWPGGEPRVDPVEIAEVRWFDPSDRPPGLGSGTRAVLETLTKTAEVPGTSPEMGSHPQKWGGARHLPKTGEGSGPSPEMGSRPQNWGGV